MLTRRRALAGAGAAAMLGAMEACSPLLQRPPAPLPPGPPLRASVDRITAITVCTRPFRAQGPRLDVERVGEQTIVHNYGHGGSGWSLSWGSGAIAARQAMASGERDIGVIGCGALGLTSALLLQRAGAKVTIYTRDLPPKVRSSLASGIWSPDSRICLQQHATPAFKKTWEAMARESFQAYQNLLGLPGDPVEFIDNYRVSDTADMAAHADAPADGRPAFADLQRELIDDLIPDRPVLAPGTHALGARYLRRATFMMFNLTAYARLLLSDFLAAGGRIRIAEFHAPADFAALPQRTLVNATGYGARALFGDQSLTPVRGQLARMIPQPDIRYGLFYKDVSFVPRRDGMVFQVVGESDYYGYDDETTVADPAEARHAVETIASLFA